MSSSHEDNSNKRQDQKPMSSVDSADTKPVFASSRQPLPTVSNTGDVSAHHHVGSGIPPSVTPPMNDVKIHIGQTAGRLEDSSPSSTATSGGASHANNNMYRRYGAGSKERLRLLLDEPNSSPLAFWVSVLIALTIVSSSVTAIVETVPYYYKSQERLWVLFESIIVAVFTFEFATRCYAHSSTMTQFIKFCRSFYTVIDLVAIVPFYLGILAYQDTWSDMQRFTVLRLFRLLRLFRCYTFSSLLQLSIDALIMSLRKSVDALLALLVFISFIMVAFSTLMYFAERGIWDPVRRAFIDINGEVSQFSSIPHSLWFVAEIITTVGLGDIHPKTVTGKTIAVPLMMFSLLIIALPSIVIGRNFAESWAWLRSTRPMRIPISSQLSPTSVTGATTLGTGMAAVTLTTATTGASATAPTGSPPPLGRESQFLAELSSTQLATQLPVELPGAADRIPLPAPSTDIGEHGEVMLGILQELQRQNELLERLVLAAHTGDGANRQYSSLVSRSGSFTGSTGGNLSEIEDV